MRSRRTPHIQANSCADAGSRCCWYGNKFFRTWGIRSMLDSAIYTGNWRVVSLPLPQKMLILETGASHAPNFSKTTTHLLCPSRQGPKAEKALKWGIPVVDMVWLEGLAVSTADSPTTEAAVKPLPPLCEDGEGEVTEPSSVLQRAPFCLPPFFP